VVRSQPSSEPVDVGGVLAVREASVAGTAVEERRDLGARVAQLPRRASLAGVSMTGSSLVPDATTP
jgi:hypothetical protein